MLVIIWADACVAVPAKATIAHTRTRFLIKRSSVGQKMLLLVIDQRDRITREDRKYSGHTATRARRIDALDQLFKKEVIVGPPRWSGPDTQDLSMTRRCMYLTPSAVENATRLLETPIRPAASHGAWRHAGDDGGRIRKSKERE
jgi:hypothetical protein